MRFLISVICLAVGWATFAQADTPSALRRLITGDDGRGWEAVGRLNIEGHSMCTGALIAPDLVLTAAHCLYDRNSGARVDPAQIEFLAGLRNGRASAYRWVRRAVVHPEYTFQGEGSPEVHSDLAILVLERPIRNSSIVPFETDDRPAPGDEVGVVSYAQNRSEVPSLEETCHVLARQHGALVMSCDVDFGSSGAPVFVMGDDGRPRIVSVISAKAELDDEPVSIGTSLEGTLDDIFAVLGSENRLPQIATSAPRRLTLDSTRDSTGAHFLRP